MSVKFNSKRYCSNNIKRIVLLILCLINHLGYSQSLDSSIIVDSLLSDRLNEKKTFFIYLPKRFEPSKTYPVVYCTDGQSMVQEGYTNLLDSLIALQIIRPIVVVGAFANEEKVDGNISVRQIEYIKHFNKSKTDIARFQNHQYFFLNELPELIIKRYQVKTDTNNLTFFGTSNGAGFGLTLFLENKTSFKHFICLSPLGNMPVKKIKHLHLPSLYVSYGIKEPTPLVAKYEKTVQALLKKDHTFSSNKFDGGHEHAFWKVEFTRTLSLLFGSLN